MARWRPGGRLHGERSESWQVAAKMEVAAIAARGRSSQKDKAAPGGPLTKTSRPVRTALLSSMAAGGKPIELWSQSLPRARPEGATRWARKGTHREARMPMSGHRSARAPLMVRPFVMIPITGLGAVCPDRSIGGLIIMPTVNTEGNEKRVSQGISTKKPLMPARVLGADGTGCIQNRRRSERPREHHVALPAAAPRPGTEPDGAGLGISAWQQAMCCRPG